MPDAKNSVISTVMDEITSLATAAGADAVKVKQELQAYIAAQDNDLTQCLSMAEDGHEAEAISTARIIESGVQLVLQDLGETWANDRRNELASIFFVALKVMIQALANA